VIQIRHLRRSDHHGVLRINAESTPGVARLEPSDLEEFARCPRNVAIAERSGEVVGYLITVPSGGDYAGEEYRWFASRYEQFLYIDQVAVRPDVHHRGVATQLYAWAKRRAAALELPRLTCEVTVQPPNPASLAFHQALGFSTIDTFATADARLVALMCREL
jgi:uncharacterized protein